MRLPPGARTLPATGSLRCRSRHSGLYRSGQRRSDRHHTGWPKWSPTSRRLAPTSVASVRSACVGQLGASRLRSDSLWSAWRALATLVGVGTFQTLPAPLDSIWRRGGQRQSGRYYSYRQRAAWPPAGWRHGALRRSAPVRSALVRSALVKSASISIAPRKSTPTRSASRKHTSRRSASRSWAPLRSTRRVGRSGRLRIRSAILRSGVCLLIRVSGRGIPDDSPRPACVTA